MRMKYIDSNISLNISFSRDNKENKEMLDLLGHLDLVATLDRKVLLEIMEDLDLM